MIEDKALTYAKQHNITRNQALVILAKQNKAKKATKEFKVEAVTKSGPYTPKVSTDS